VDLRNNLPQPVPLLASRVACAPDTMEVLLELLDVIKPHATGLACGSVLSIAFNTAARANPDARRLVAGTPLYIYAVAMIFQAVVFAPTAFVAWHRWGFDPQWFQEGWQTTRDSVNVNPMGDKKRIERVYLYALWGYMIKVKSFPFTTFREPMPMVRD
jgi:hypothetical protein